MTDISWTSRAPDPGRPRPGSTAVDPTPPNSRSARPGSFGPGAVQAAAALAAGVAAEVARRWGITSIGATMLVTAVAAAGLTVRSRRHDQGWAAGMVVLGACFALRSAPWLMAIDLAAVVGITAIAAGRPDRGPLRAMAAVGGARTVVRLGPAALGDLGRLGARALPEPTADRTARLKRALRSALISTPILALVGGLLFTADALARSWLSVPSADPELFVSAVTVLGGVWFVLVLRRSHLDDAPSPAWRWWRPGRLDVLVTMAGTAVLVAAYVAVRVTAALAGDGYVQARTGLTYAEYARGGFFQLVAVAAITLAVVLGAQNLLPSMVGWPRRLALLIGVLDLALVTAAHRGFVLYQRAYGLTRLRITCVTILVWIAVVVVVVTAGCWCRRLQRAIVTVVVVTGAVAVVVLNAVNPDLLIARTNLDLGRRTGRIDVDYLRTLSPDAAPALASTGQLATLDRLRLAGAWCTDDGAGWNWSESAADRACDRADFTSATSRP